VDGEARRAGREARRPELHLSGAARAAALLALAACASVGDPPGGPPDTTPPVVKAVTPDSGSVVQPPHEVDIQLDEVVQERVAAPRPDISSAVLLSPVRGPVNVQWHRDRISVRPKEGFQPGRVYRLELFPVLTDLRQNRMRQGHVWVFSTGPDIPTATLSGTVVDWVGAKAGGNALVEAVLLPDSLPYRTLADSAGNFALRQVPPGEYLVYGVIDQDNNRQRGPREAYDTGRVHLADTASLELYAFTHDTSGPRLRSVEAADSVTLRLTFDRALDPALRLDTGAVRFALLADSTSFLPLVGVWTQAEADSLRNAEAARRAAADSARLRAREDSTRARAGADTTRARPPADTAGAHRVAPADTSRARPPVPPPAQRPPAPPPGQRPTPSPTARPTAQPGVRPLPQATAPGAAPQTPGQPGRASGPRDSTRAMKMLARRPAPTPVRLVRLASPLVPGSRYIVRVSGVRGLSGPPADVRGQISVPIPKPASRAERSRAAADTLHPPADTSARRPAPPDTARSPAASARPPAADTAHPAIPPSPATSRPPPTPVFILPGERYR